MGPTPRTTPYEADGGDDLFRDPRRRAMAIEYLRGAASDPNLGTTRPAGGRAIESALASAQPQPYTPRSGPRAIESALDERAPHRYTPGDRSAIESAIQVEDERDSDPAARLFATNPDVVRRYALGEFDKPTGGDVDQGAGADGPAEFDVTRYMGNPLVRAHLLGGGAPGSPRAIESAEPVPTPRPSADDSPFSLGPVSLSRAAEYLRTEPSGSRAIDRAQPIRVQRNDEGRITSASNIAGASGGVFPSGGEPGRGAFNQSSLDDVAYLPESVYEDAHKRRQFAEDRMLARDPMAIEREQERIRTASDERRLAIQERIRAAGSNAEQQRRFVISQAREKEAEINSRVRGGELTPEEGQRKLAALSAKVGQHLYALEQGLAEEAERKRQPNAYGDGY